MTERSEKAGRIKVPRSFYDEVMKVSQEFGISAPAAVQMIRERERLAIENTQINEVRMKEGAVSEPKSRLVPAEGVTAPLKLGDDPAPKEPQGLPKGMTTELLEFGLRVGQENAEMRQQVKMLAEAVEDTRAGVVAGVVGLADHLTQHEKGEINPQLTREAMLSALTQAKFSGNKQNTAKVLEQAFRADLSQGNVKTLEKAIKPAEDEVADVSPS